VDDSFEVSGGGSSGSEAFSGPETSPFGTASVTLDTDDCRYVLTVDIGANTMFSGEDDLNPGPGVSVLAFGDRNPIPKTCT
jgi:hypothetical protein